MRFTLSFNPEFYTDLEQAIDWYEEQRPGLGKNFYLSVRDQILRLQSTALNFSIRYDDIRCLTMKKFPYMIHYRIDIETCSVKIEALFHTSRNPAVWSKRK